MLHIYCILCLANKKIYIGKHFGDLNAYLDLNYSRATRTKRWNDKPLLYRAMRKYRREDFVIFSLVRPIDDAQANALEKFFIRTEESRNPEIGYNLAEGGTGGNTREGRKHRVDSLEKMRMAQLGRPKTPEHRKNISIAKTGIPVPAVAESNIRRRNPNPTPAALRNRLYRERLKNGTNPRAGKSEQSISRE